MTDEISISYGEIFTKEKDSLDNLSGSDNLTRLSAIINDIEEMHAEGKINNERYAKLKKDTSILYQELFRRRIDSLNTLPENDNGKLLDEIKEDISDAYSKDKISELHYTLLEKKLSNYEKQKRDCWPKRMIKSNGSKPDRLIWPNSKRQILQCVM